MRRYRDLGIVLVTLLPLLLALTACSGSPSAASGSAPSTEPAAAATSAGCPGAGGGRPVAWTDGSSAREALVFDAAAGAPATTAVVVSNQSDEQRCSWAPYVSLLATGGQVWLYDFGAPASDGTGVTDVKAVVAKVVASGAQHVLLVGASKGAKASLVAAATVTPPVSGVVALSPEAALADGKPVLDAITKATFPTLIVTADADPYQAAPASQAFAAARPSVTRLVVVKGSAHGTALFVGDTAAPTTQAVSEFLAQHR